LLLFPTPSPHKRGSEEEGPSVQLTRASRKPAQGLGETPKMGVLWTNRSIVAPIVKRVRLNLIRTYSS
uniref:Uncharacterized protein n=1 Tax=Callorhinchus milii TaxID=7868 RepID=A0A4W3IFD9_CALMI